MAYFCYIDCEALSIPHMEPLDAATAEDARREALSLLSQHSSAIAAHVYFGDERLCTIPRQDRAR